MDIRTGHVIDELGKIPSNTIDFVMTSPPYMGTEPGLALDPFVGSGTVAAVAKRKSMNFIGIDISPKYVRYTKHRLSKTPRGARGVFK